MRDTLRTAGGLLGGSHGSHTQVVWHTLGVDQAAPAQTTMLGWPQR